MIHSQPFVDKLPIELTVLVGLFESICNFNDLCGVNQVDSSVSTNLTRMILGMETIFLDLLSLSSLDKLCPDNSRIGCVDCGYGRPSVRPRVPHPATYYSSTPRMRDPAVARWQAHLHGLATPIRELSGLEEVMGRGLCLMIRLRRSTTAETTIIPRSLKAPKRTDSITSRHPLCPTLLLSSKGYQKETGVAVSISSARI